MNNDDDNLIISFKKPSNRTNIDLREKLCLHAKEIFEFRQLTMQQEGNINEDTSTRFKCDVKTPCQCGVVVRYIRLLIEPSENVAQVELKFSTGTTGDENIDEDTEIIEYEDKDKDEEDEGCEEENPEPPLGQWSQEDYNNKDEEDSDTSSSISVIYGIGGS